MIVKSGFCSGAAGLRPSSVSKVWICRLSYWLTLQPSVSMAKVRNICYSLAVVSYLGKVGTQSY